MNKETVESMNTMPFPRDFDESQINIAKLLEKISPIYQKYYLKREIFRDQFDDGYKALICFLENYAYERQGAAAAYPKIACKCVSDMYDNGKSWNTPSETDAKNLWENYKKMAKEEFNLIEKVNALRNPMNEDGGVVKNMASKKVQNIAIYIRDFLEDGKTKQAYNFIKSIRGVGRKISSFYLRDIAYLTELDENNITDLYLLQPIDTWLEQTLKVLFNSNVPKKLEEKQRLIVELSKKAGISSIAFNQGAWVLGSQIAGEFETFEKALTEKGVMREIITQHIEEKEKYLDVLKNISV